MYTKDLGDTNEFLVLCTPTKVQGQALVLSSQADLILRMKVQETSIRFT